MFFDINIFTGQQPGSFLFLDYLNPFRSFDFRFDRAVGLLVVTDFDHTVRSRNGTLYPLQIAQVRFDFDHLATRSTIDTPSTYSLSHAVGPEAHPCAKLWRYPL